MKSQIHIVCPCVPWPLHDKKAIDIFNQLRILHENNISVHLHYFCSEKNCHPTELNRYCISVNRYHELEKQKLFDALQADNLPILFEGSNLQLDIDTLSRQGRKIIHRMYDTCTCPNQAGGSSLLSKIPFLRKEKPGQEEFAADCLYLFAFENDLETIENKEQGCQSRRIPLLDNFKEVKSVTGLGSFCLYHGNLADSSNEKAALWLLEKVFNDLSIPLIIAGHEPGRKIEKMAELYTHCCLVSDPSTDEMNDLIKKAQIHVLPSFSCRHPELKLIHSLHEGRHCLVNEEAIKNTGMDEACHIANNPAGFKSVILQLFYRPFEEEEIKLRERLFRQLHQNDSGKIFIETLFQ